MENPTPTVLDSIIIIAMEFSFSYSGPALGDRAIRLIQEAIQRY